MRTIRKKLVTDEDLRPVAVQIDYADWIRIEQQLELAADAPKETDLARHRGVLTLREDPLAYQERVRAEWP
jgi:hypothetical protein